MESDKDVRDHINRRIWLRRIGLTETWFFIKRIFTYKNKDK